MFRTLAKILSVLLLTASLLSPLTSGLAMAVGLSEGRVLVICTGDGLRWIKIDAEGEPVELSASAEACALLHAADTSAKITVTPAEPVADVAYRPVLAGKTPRADAHRTASLPRAPPAL